MPLSHAVILLLGLASEPISPENSLAAMKLPEGFRVSLVDGEPGVIKPIHMTTDARGRLWVVESHSYPHWLKEDAKVGKDRVLVYERDGAKWKQTVFLKDGVNLSGIAVGFGGVWLCSVPRVVFIPADLDTLKPTGEAVVKLDGFSLKTKHNVVSNLAWGPDGWLYGLNGIQSEARIGPPGTADRDRVRMSCGVWRYHPARKVVEAFAHGTTNPWGLDWNEAGELFITNCVIKHLFHVVPGAHFVRMYGQDVNPHTYGLLESCADHRHWGEGSWTDSRGGKKEHSAAGGGHAHAGAMFYLGDNWPAEHRGRIFMANIHGNRLNQDRLERKGSTYVAKHCEDFLLANDPWFRGITLLMAPDGGVFVSDWHDTGECHNYDRTHPSGRIYHITFGSPRWPAVDLWKATDVELAKHQLHKNDWWARHARLVIQERAAAGKLGSEAVKGLESILKDGKDVTHRLRALWALRVCGGLSQEACVGLLKDREEAVRAWAVRLAVENPTGASEEQERLWNSLIELARREKSPTVRRELASAMQRLRQPVLLLALANAMTDRAEDAADPYLPLLTWYGIERFGDNLGITARLLREARIPLVRRHLARKYSGYEVGLRLVASSLEDASAEAQRDLLAGLGEGLAGRKRVSAPDGWAGVRARLAKSDDPEVRRRVLQLSLLFGDREALAVLKAWASNARADRSDREFALGVLLDDGSEEAAALARGLLADPVLRPQALRGLARFGDPRTPALVLDLYPKLTAAEKEDAIGTLASRPAYALALLDAVEAKKVPRLDISAYWARQMLALKDGKVRERLATVWGTVRPPGKDKEALMKRYKALAAEPHRSRADLSAGRGVYAKACASCHKMFGEGGSIGPELTGSQRANADYLLHKLLDPSAAVPRDFQVTAFRMASGRTLTGFVREEDDKVVVVQSPTELVRLLKSDVESREALKTSLMPEGMLQSLSEEQVRDLLAYLASPKQVPAPPRKEK
jgi:putative membrane-bound dehydrogenase-like protein